MKIKNDSILLSIVLNKKVSWMIGIWIGDNWSHREGTIIRNGVRSSGRFGIINNDKDTIKRFMEGLKKEFKQNNVKIDAQIPINKIEEKDTIKREVCNNFDIEFGNVNAYKGSPWRKKTGYAVYVNNTTLLRAVNNEIFKKLLNYIKTGNIDIRSLMQGICDAEGCADKANKKITIINKDDYVNQIIFACLRKLKIPFKKRTDKKKRTIFSVNNFKLFNERIGFCSERKNRIINDMINNNFTREKDIVYLENFSNDLKDGCTAIGIHEKFNIAHPTAKMILRNLVSGGFVQAQKRGKAYIYKLS